MENQEQITPSVVAETITTEQKTSHFAEVLARNTSTIKKDRAEEIAELSEITFKRKVEDSERELKLLERKKKGSLDLSPDNTYTLMKVKDFDPDEFQRYYADLGLKIREAKIVLNNAKAGYNELFGNTYTLEQIL